MIFEHKIPKIYYSQNEDTSPERMKLEIDAIKKKFPEYDVKLSKDLFNNKNEWIARIDSFIEIVDVIIFSCPNECREGFLFSEKYEHEFTLAIKRKKVTSIICGKEIKTLSNSNWVNTAMQSIKQRR